VDSNLNWDPEKVAFNSSVANSQIRDILQIGAGGCTSCHANNVVSPVPPSFYNDYDRVPNGVTAGTDATNRNWLYTEIRGRINFTDLIASPLLRKPSGNHHNGGLRPGFDTSKPVGDTARESYDKITAWILRDAPEN
jgi:hypothetical protein